jgi:hypothetical protein
MKMDSFDLQWFIDKLADIDSNIKCLQNEREEILEALAEQHAPCRPGDTVKIKGYSYAGRDLLVNRVIAGGGRFHRGYQFTIVGNVMKADGSVGKQGTSFTEPIGHVHGKGNAGTAESGC